MSESSWLDPYISFLSDGSLPTNVKEAERMLAHFWLSKDKKLYWQSFGGPYLLCLHSNNVAELLVELHKRIYGGHSWGRSLSDQAMTQGFWWLNMQRAIADYIRKCNQCQRHASIIHQPGGNLNPITSPLPFAQWGLDIFGPFLQATGNRRFVLVATNYFTKWVEAEALENIRGTSDIGFKQRIAV